MARTRHTHKGFYKPYHPEKYAGNPTNIVYRSSWELLFCRYLDDHPDVISWSSEEFSIPYKSVDGRYHRYFPDFKVKFRDATNREHTTVFEIKPQTQRSEPKMPLNGPNKAYLTEVLRYGKDLKKWEAATLYCKKNGWEFKLLSEKELGIKYGH